MTEVTISELERARAAGEILVDVREPDEYAAGHVPGAHLLPLADAGRPLARGTAA